MKNITAGIIAHVDAGKTTLSEALLYKAGNLRKLGRVDKANSFLDSDDLEKKRSITIFSHQAQLNLGELNLTLLDTPGHIDFANQTENVLSVLDYAILVLSATDSISGYIQTLWSLLEKYEIPTFIFVNKIDLSDKNENELLNEIQKSLDPNAVNFMQVNKVFYENIATSNEAVLDEFLEKETINDDVIQNLIKKREIFPVYFGSALKLENVDIFENGLKRWTENSVYAKEFGAKIFKITHDENQRLTWLKVTGGQLQAKQELNSNMKIDQVRQYNGPKFKTITETKAGSIVTVSGLNKTYPGQGLGIEKDQSSSVFKPVLSYKVNPINKDIHECLEKFRILEDEDTTLKVDWLESLNEIRIQVMGKIQLEIIKQLLKERYDLEVEFEEGSILYKETITDSIEAVGHFEPLRHYAEVHLLLEPGKPNSGLIFENKCSLEVLSKNWQHQIMTALTSKTHLGVLAAFPITDMKITLIGGKGSNVHTVGGDFRQATYRAVRQGLMELKQKQAVKLLEPWYDFTLRLKQDEVGRAMNDIQNMKGVVNTPVQEKDYVVLTGKAPVANMQDYASEVRNYSHGQGSLECIISGYQDCHDSKEIITQKDYDPVSDLENTPNSVFCSHGAGHTVVWDKVPEKAQFPYTFPISDK